MVVEAGYEVSLQLREGEQILETHYRDGSSLLEVIHRAASVFDAPGCVDHADHLRRFGKKPPHVKTPDTSHIPDSLRMALKETAESEDRDAWIQILGLLGDPPEKEALYGELCSPEICLSLWLSHLELSVEAESFLRRQSGSTFGEDPVIMFAFGEEQKGKGKYGPAGLIYHYARENARNAREPRLYVNFSHWANYRLGEVGSWTP